MSAVVVAVAALVASLLALVVALALGRRSRAAADKRLATVFESLNERLGSISAAIGQILERREEEERRTRFLGELAGSIDLDEVLSRTLEAAGALPGADAALVSIEGFEGKQGKRIVATVGLSVEEAERHAIAGPPDGRPVRSISIGYQYTPEQPAGEGGLLHSGLAVPLSGEDGQLGYLAVFSRSSTYELGEQSVRELEELALRAGPAIENARRFREARQLADLDALTGLHNRRYFHETLAREVARAQRYRRALALIVFDLDDFKAINDRIGHLAGDAVLAEAAERVRDIVRSADIACRVGGDEFAVILPESTLSDAEALSRRLQTAMSSRPAGQARLLLSAGVAELRPEDDGVSFFQQADEALYRAKEAGKGQVVVAASDAG